MARDRGQLIKKGDQKYLIRVYLGRVDGRRKYVSKTIRGTRKEADAVLTKWLREMDTDTYVAPQEDKRLSEVLQEWLATAKVEAQTFANYEARIRLQILPHLGAFRLNQLTAARLQDWINHLETQYSVQTIIHCRNVLAQALKLAQIRGYLSRNPLLGVKLPKKPAYDRTAGVLTRDQVQHLVEATREERYGPLWALLLGTGLRPQEALALQWSDIDWDNGVVTLRRVLRNWNSGQTLEVVTQGKTRTALQPVSLPSSVLWALQGHRVRMFKEQMELGYRNPEGWVFVTNSGNHPLPNALRKSWYSALRRHGLPKIKLYNTRHTHATLLIEANVHMKAVQARLRHSNISTTMDFYGKVTPAMDTAAAETYDQILEA